VEVEIRERQMETGTSTETEIGSGGKNSREMGLFCPLCNVFAGRRIRNKLYCGNCGFVES